MLKVIIASLLMLGSLSGCVDTQSNLLCLDEQYLARRQIETRHFEAKNEQVILDAAIQTLQDLGYTVAKCEPKCGIITAYKDCKPDFHINAVRVGEAMMQAFLGLQSTQEYDVAQRIVVDLVVAKIPSQSGYNVRITFGNKIKTSQGNTRTRWLDDKKLYQQFFECLSKSLLLTAYNI